MNTTLDTTALQNLLSELSQTLQTGDLSKNENARQDALRISRKLTARLQTPSELAFGTCFLPAYSACCRAAIHIGLFEVISKSAGPITATEIADQTNAQHLLIVRLLRVITGLGLVSEVGLETYRALPATHAMVSPMIRAAYQHFWDQGAASLINLPAYLTAHGSRCPTDARDGLFQHAFATSLDAFSYWQAQPAPRRALDNFNFLMTCIRGEEPAWLSWFPVSEHILQECRPNSVVLVDVGGGRGHDAVAFKRRTGADFPKGGRVIVEDLPAVLADVEQLEDGIEKVEHNFFTPQIITGARVYYHAHILHDWSDDAAAKILRNAKGAMEPGYSKIFLYEFILPDTDCSLVQAGFDIQMMGMHAGMERTRAQWTKLIEGEGFKVVKFWIPPGDGEGIIEVELVE